MTPEQFKMWRRSLGLKQKEAAEVLGLKKRMIQYYEKGEREDRKVEIPKSVRLACFALLQGIGDFDGEKITELKLSVNTLEDETTRNSP
ncbi:XRE family transcriptional regulator [Rhodobacteraceae bacterium RKSG542]|uniref:helix-turn-helix domain-containing protein n=1 Tax=Pseudovibrio flavus TaxID=2529854 RepID=UPI0012BD0E12|nr:helix-turn-helix transcriptional regulator [Pseudovibrio flavus]MTI19079.1 XRE family transcriptional regulator [Pseudovibrio flavus]